MQAFIFAAGLGTRLKPLTLTMPKALVPIAGEPLIDMVLNRLKSADIDDFVVNVHHFPEQIIDHLSKRSDLGRVQISDESEMLRDTGGAVRYAQNLLDKSTPFLVHNVDIVSNLDIREFVAQFKSDALAMLLVSERKTQRYLLFDDEMRLCGWTNVATGEVKSSIKDIDVTKYRKLAFAGIHILSHKVLDLMQEYDEKFSIIDFYLNSAAQYPIYGYIQPDLKMVDVGKFDSLEQAELMIKEIEND